MILTFLWTIVHFTSLYTVSDFQVLDKKRDNAENEGEVI